MMDGDSLRQGGGHQADDALDDLLQIEDFPPNLSPAREGEQLLGQMGHVLGCFFQKVQEFKGRRTVGNRFTDQLGIGDEGGEQVVEIMRDLAGNRSGSFEAFGTVQPGLDEPAFILGGGGFLLGRNQPDVVPAGFGVRVGMGFEREEG